MAPKIRTALTEMLGIDIPVVQGGMHYVGYAELAAAVSEAGGLGIITALTQATPEDLRKEIHKARTLTQKPLGVNLTLLPVSATTPDYEAYAQICVDEKIPVVETAGRNPDNVIELFKKNGIKVIHKCTRIKHAIAAQNMGVDMLSIDGSECGGIHDNIKKSFVSADELSTTFIFTTLSNTERVFRNTTSMKVREIERENPGDFTAIRPYVLGENYRRAFQETGDVEASCFSCGQSLGLIHDIPTCKNLLATIEKDCIDQINSMKARL